VERAERGSDCDQVGVPGLLPKKAVDGATLGGSLNVGFKDSVTRDKIIEAIRGVEQNDHLSVKPISRSGGRSAIITSSRQ
jgi:hypothetical protein